MTDGQSRVTDRLLGLFRVLTVLCLPWVLGAWSVGCVFVGFWPGLICLFLLSAGYAGLRVMGRWEGDLLALMGWVLLGLLFQPERRVFDWLLTSALWICFAAYLRALNRWLWELPITRAQARSILCSLLIGVGLLFRPYLVARYLGHRANLQRASLILADLRRADLRSANLRGADLRGACLWGADLAEADLTDAILDGAVYDSATVGNWDALDKQGASCTPP
jgi:hypothetical protein